MVLYPILTAIYPILALIARSPTQLHFEDLGEITARVRSAALDLPTRPPETP